FNSFTFTRCVLYSPGLILLYPLYASLRAIESPSLVDDQQWLTYWIIYSFITLFELSFWKVLAWYVCPL
ncbi:HVA22-like protein f, partial [Linum perenne]